MSDLSKIIISTLSINVFYDAKSRSSGCWKYFGHLVASEGHKKKILNSGHVYCLACLTAVKKQSEDVVFGSIKIKRYNKNVSTGNLTRHLRDDHNIQEEVRASKEKPKPVKIKGSTSATKPVRHDKWTLAKDLALWFCKSLLPFDSVSDEGMVDFFKKYDITLQDDDFPSRSTVSGSALSDLYESMLAKVEETIANDAAQHFALTFDLWTDLFRRLTYITFTLHYLTSEFILRTLTLSTEIMNEKITAENLNDAIQEIKKRFELNGKEIVAVTDSGANVQRAVTMANMTHHLCLGNALHKLVTIDGISLVPEITSVVEKCKKIVKAVRYRASQMEAEAKQVQELEFLGKLVEVIENLELDESDPIVQDDSVNLKMEIVETEFGNKPTRHHKHIPKMKTEMPTRWHNILEMLESVIHVCNRETINDMLSEIDQEELRISQREWILLEELVKFLGCFREAVEILSSQKTCTLNVALVFRSEIIDVLKSCQDNESIIMLHLKSNMLANIDKRFPVTKEIAAAALLDSRFMSLKEIDVFLEKKNMTRAYFLSSYIKEIIGVVNMPETLQEEGKSNETSLLHKLSKKHSISTSQGVQDDLIEQECWRYIAAADPLEPKDGNLLSYWNSKKKAFPNLAALAKVLLCVPATSTPSERIFSVVGLTTTAKRSRLSPAMLNKIIFIHDNYKTCKTDERE